MLNFCHEDKVEKETLKSKKVLQHYNFIMGELIFKLQKFDVVSLKSWSPPLVKNNCNF